MEVKVVSNTGAYGGHGGETLAAALGSPLTAYRCPNKKADGFAVYTNIVPGGGFRGYGASQSTFAVECAIDELSELLGMDPFAIRRQNMVRPDDWIESVWKDPTHVGFGSYGLDQCLDLVETALAADGGLSKPDGEDWAEGRVVISLDDESVKKSGVKPPCAVNLLLQTRTQVLDEDLGDVFRRWYPKFRPQPQMQEPERKVA